MLVDVGQLSKLRGSLGRMGFYLSDSSFCFTYGDVVADLKIGKLLAQHPLESR
jgi:hypothetical protein